MALESVRVPISIEFCKETSGMSQLINNNKKYESGN